MINLNLEVRGRYKVLVECGLSKDIKYDLEFDNLIVNTGLDAIGLELAQPSSSIGGFVTLAGGFVLGSGNTPPQPTDVKLETPIKHGGNGSVTRISNLEEFPTTKVTATYSRTFAQGFWIGNVSEIGLQKDRVDGRLFSRALILDLEGNPTTITLLGTDIVTLSYIFTIHYPEDISGSVPVETSSGTQPLNFTVRPSALATAIGVDAAVGPSGDFRIYTVNAALGPVSGYPSGSVLPASGSTYTPNPYIQGSYSRTAKITVPVQLGNGSIKAVAWRISLLGGWQVLFETPIVKDNTQILELEVGLTWSRHV